VEQERTSSKPNLHNVSTKSFKFKDSRFKEISVHEHLYLTGKKLEKKKEIQKVLDQQYHS
jgi:flagellar basal body rod protein FlgG